MLEGERDRVVCRPALQLDFFRGSRRIVDGDVQAGVPGGVIGREPLHARPAAGVSARVPKRPLPQAALHFARAAREHDVRLAPQVGDGDLRKRDLPQLPVGRRFDCATSSESRWQSLIRRRHGFDAQVRPIRPVDAPDQVSFTGPSSRRSIRASRQPSSAASLVSSLAPLRRSVNENSGSGWGANSCTPDAASSNCKRRIPVAVCSSSRPRSPADSICSCCGSLPSAASSDSWKRP